MAAKVDMAKCTGCGVCVDACPLEAISLENGKAVVSDSCTGCGSCVDACPNGALSL
ncbi:MAG: 4Fe-4S dicluster domain-containing protein [Chitinivibrionales bacterium]|nr:4Fe-4S dicluster domain-containing protein [Chitinivibrionales bacterium]MBD3394440.1 4Fe-4S dicluster domain-containing protein [Chitinivibrionales bacterium]